MKSNPTNATPFERYQKISSEDCSNRVLDSEFNIDKPFQHD